MVYKQKNVKLGFVSPQMKGEVFRQKDSYVPYRDRLQISLTLLRY